MFFLDEWTHDHTSRTRSVRNWAGAGSSGQSGRNRRHGRFPYEGTDASALCTTCSAHE